MGVVVVMDGVSPRANKDLEHAVEAMQAQEVIGGGLGVGHRLEAFADVDIKHEIHAAGQVKAGVKGCCGWGSGLIGVRDRLQR